MPGIQEITEFYKTQGIVVTFREASTLDPNVELATLRENERELSDAYMRIRTLVGAWDTKFAGVDRFELTEQKIKDLQNNIEVLSVGRLDNGPSLVCTSCHGVFMDGNAECNECSGEIYAIRCAEHSYPPGSMGYERQRLERDMAQAVGALPWWCRWWGKRKLRKIDQEWAIIDAQRDYIVESYISDMRRDQE